VTFLFFSWSNLADLPLRMPHSQEGPPVASPVRFSEEEHSPSSPTFLSPILARQGHSSPSPRRSSARRTTNVLLRSAHQNAAAWRSTRLASECGDAESSDEDSSDEAFLLRHLPYEKVQPLQRGSGHGLARVGAAHYSAKIFWDDFLPRRGHLEQLSTDHLITPRIGSRNGTTRSTSTPTRPRTQASSPGSNLSPSPVSSAPGASPIRASLHSRGAPAKM